MGLFSAYIWHNSSLLYHFRHLSGRNIYSAFILSEKVVFCDYMTWNAGISEFIRMQKTYVFNEKYLISFDELKSGVEELTKYFDQNFGE